MVIAAMKLKDTYSLEGLLCGSDSKASASQCGRLGFHPWVRKIPWRREWLPTPVFLPGEFHGQRSLQATVHVVTGAELSDTNTYELDFKQIEV